MAVRDLLHGRLKRHVRSDAVAQAIARAEAASTGRIRVSILPHFWGDAREAAEHVFSRYALHHVRDRNAVLFVVIPSRKEFVVYGGAGIHERVGQEYWDRLAAALSECIKNGDLTSALVWAIEDVGKQLAAHFPKRLNA